MKKLVEMLAAAQVGLDQIADRVDALESIAVTDNGHEDQYQDVDAGPPENGAGQAPAADGAAPHVPTRPIPSTPDLRWDQ